jgi:sugar phosphate isomerase/epimerase
MQPCLDPACIGFDVDLETYVAAAAAGGFEVVEVPITWVDDVVRGNGTARVDALFRTHGIAAAQFTCGLGIPGNLAVPDDLFESRLRDLPRYADLARSVGCGRASMFADGRRHEGVPLPTAVIVDRVTRIAAVLAAAGLALSVGFIGRERLLVAGDIWSEVGAPSTGLLIDTISMAKAGLGAEWIDDLPAGSVGWLRVADAPVGVADDDITYTDRLLPGTGRLPLDDIYAAVRRNGYRGPVSVEVGDPMLAAHPPAERARLAYAHTAATLTG